MKKCKLCGKILEHESEYIMYGENLDYFLCTECYEKQKLYQKINHMAKR